MGKPVLTHLAIPDAPKLTQKRGKAPACGEGRGGECMGGEGRGGGTGGLIMECNTTMCDDDV